MKTTTDNTTNSFDAGNILLCSLQTNTVGSVSHKDPWLSVSRENSFLKSDDPEEPMGVCGILTVQDGILLSSNFTFQEAG